MEEIYAFSIEDKVVYQYDFNLSTFIVAQNLSAFDIIDFQQIIIDFDYDRQTNEFFLLLTDQNRLTLDLKVIDLKDNSTWTIDFHHTSGPKRGMILDTDLNKLNIPIDLYGVYIYDLISNTSQLIEGAVLTLDKSPFDLFFSFLLLSGIIAICTANIIMIVLSIFLIKRMFFESKKY